MDRSALRGALLLAGLCVAAGIRAQDAAQASLAQQWYQGSHAPELKATQSCGTPTEISRYPTSVLGADPGAPAPIETTSFTVKSWTGGCENGKRSGRGVLVTRVDISDTSADSRHITRIVKSEGSFVAGLKQGLWCVLDYQALADGEKDEWDTNEESGCRLVIGHPWDGLSASRESPYFRRLADGRWQQMDAHNKPVLPEVYLPAGSVEAESERIIAEARAGKTDISFKPMNVETNLLDGLVVGTHISEGKPVLMSSIKGKRVALVLSSNMLAELERFNRERQALLDASAGFTGRALAARNRFEAASRQERLIQAMASALRRQAGEVTAVDDLSGLASGKFDYAYVLDWHSLSHLDLLGKFKDFPEYEMGQDQGTNYVAGQALGGFLISPEMKVVSRGASSGEFDYKIGQCTQTRSDRGCDAQYLEILAKFYESAWETSDRRTLY